MPKCGYCGSTIFLGGVTASGQRYCNNKCLQSAYILGITKDIPADVLDRKVEEVWHDNCPKCRGPGPVDVHKVHEVWSCLVLTRWTTKAQLSCRSCGVKRQVGGLFFSLLCGWWGFPWGLVLTPVQVSRNIAALCHGGDSSRPSEELRRMVLVNLGAQMAANQRANAPQPPPLR